MLSGTVMVCWRVPYSCVCVCLSHSSAPVLNAVMSSFKPEYIAQQALMFADMVKACEETGLPKVGTAIRTVYMYLFVIIASLISSTSCMCP